jgi:hypothetical protein
MEKTVFLLTLINFLCIVLKSFCLQCFDQASYEANHIAENVDDILVPTLFSRVEKGYMAIVVDGEEQDTDVVNTNPDGSYGRYFFNGENILPDGVCDIPTKSGLKRCPLTGNIMLGQADAIVFAGCTPPPVKFFSFDFDIVMRFDENGYPFHPGVNFGDTVNSRTINTTAEGKDDTPFNKPIVVIHTADGESADIIRSAYVSSGSMEASSISVHALDSSTIRTWNRSGNQSWEVSKPDMLAPIVRLSVPIKGYEAQYERYKKIIWPVRFYFKDNDAIAKYPLIPELKSRYSDEVVDEISTLSESFAELERAVINRYVNEYNLSYRLTLETNFSVPGFYDDWDEILAMESNDSFVIGTRDAVYGIPVAYPNLNATPEMIFTQSTTVVVIGVQHVDVIGAAYNSVGIDIVNYTGTVFTTQWKMDNEMDGSAYRYLPANAQIEQFFAIDFKRPNECGKNPFCIEFNYTALDFDVQSYYIWLCERVYSLKATQVGPARDRTIPSRAIVFESYL